MLSPMGVRGSSDAYGSWKMICIRRRYGRRSAPLSCVMSVPSNMMEPAGGVDEPQQQPADGGLAAARFAHQAERLAAPDDEVDAVHGAHLRHGPLEHPGAHREGLHQTLVISTSGRPDPGRHRWSHAGAAAADRRRGPVCRADRSSVAASGQSSGSDRGLPSASVVQPAADVVVGRHAAQLRVEVRGEHVVVVDTRRAAGREPAARGQRDEVGHAARDDRQLVHEHTRHGHRADEAPGVGVPRLTGTGSARRSAPRSRRRTSPPPGRPSRRPRPGRG